MNFMITNLDEKTIVMFRKLVFEYSQKVGRKVTQGEYFSILVDREYASQEEEKADNDNALSIFHKDDDLDIFAPDEEEGDDTESELMIDLCNHIGYMQSEMVNLKNAIDALRVEVKNGRIESHESGLK